MKDQIISDIEKSVTFIELDKGMPNFSRNLSLTDKTFTEEEKTQIQSVFALIKSKSKSK